MTYRLGDLKRREKFRFCPGQVKSNLNVRCSCERTVLKEATGDYVLITGCKVHDGYPIGKLRTSLKVTRDDLYTALRERVEP